MTLRQSIAAAAILALSPALAMHRRASASQAPAANEVKVQSAEVVVDAIVTDRRNRIVTNLKVDDFIVSEDGVPQKVASFQLYRGTPGAGKEKEPTAAATTSALTAEASTSPLPAFTILLLDYSTVELQNQKLVREAAAKYVREKLQPNERIAIFVVSTSLRFLTDFTNDSATLLAALKASDVRGSALSAETADLEEGITKGQSTTAVPSGVSAPGAAEGGRTAGAANPGISGGASNPLEAAALRRIAGQYAALRSGIESQQTREVLTAIRAIGLGVRSIEGRKSLLLFSQGFVIAQPLWPTLQSVVDAANRAEVAIYSIDASGLQAGSLTGATVQRDEFTAGLAPSENEHPLAQMDRMKASGGEDLFDRASQVGHDLPESALRYLANSTGGFLIHNTNDLSVGLARVSEEMRTYYRLTYRPTNQAFDGGFRKIRVEMRAPQLAVRARSGYYAIAPGFELLAAEEYQVAAQWLATEATRMPLYLRAGAFREQGREYRVPVVLEIPTSEVQFEKHGDVNEARFQIVGLVRDIRNALLMRFGGRTQLTATAAEYDALKIGNISFLEMLRLPAGRPYSFEVFVKDLVSGRVSRGESGLFLREPEPELALSTILLARNAEKATGSPQFLSVEGVKILPSARCAFRNGENLIFYFDIYNPQLGADKKTDLAVEVFVLQGTKRVDLNLPDYLLSEPVSGQPSHVTVARFAQLAGLAAGEYSLVVNVHDALAGRSQSAHAAFSVVN